MDDFKAEVARAAEAMRDAVPPTPLQRNAFLSERYCADIWLKREDLNEVRSYKLRGAYTFFQRVLARPDAPRRFAAASAGNHAQGFAWCCAHMDVDGVIFMPTTTPQQKIDKTRAFGGGRIEVRQIGDTFDDCLRAALAYADEAGARFVPPFDAADTVIGQGTVTSEILQQLGRAPDMLVSPVGGGGLSAGAVGMLAGTATEMVLVEPVGAPSLAAALEAGAPVSLDRIDTFVDGAAVARIGDHPFELLGQVRREDVVTVPEDRVCGTILELLNSEGMVLEPAGALSIDVLQDIPPERLAGRTVVCIASGGNFDFERLPEVKERSLRFRGLKRYYVVRMPQRPGALKDFLLMLGPDDDIFRFEYLKKSARNFGSVLIGIDSTNPAAFDALTDRMNHSGMAWRDITDSRDLSDLLV